MDGQRSPDARCLPEIAHFCQKMAIFGARPKTPSPLRFVLGGAEVPGARAQRQDFAHHPVAQRCVLRAAAVASDTLWGQWGTQPLLAGPTATPLSQTPLWLNAFFLCAILGHFRPFYGGDPNKLQKTETLIHKHQSFTSDWRGVVIGQVWSLDRGGESWGPYFQTQNNPEDVHFQIICVFRTFWCFARCFILMLLPPFLLNVLFEGKSVFFCLARYPFQGCGRGVSFPVAQPSPRCSEQQHPPG